MHDPHALTRRAIMRAALILGAGAALVAGAHAQPAFRLRTLVLQGLPIGTSPDLLTRVDGLVVNNSAQWIVEADTNGSTLQDQVLINGAGIFLREGDPLIGLPSPITISSFDAITLNTAGNSGWNLFLDGATTTTDSGLFRNSTLVLQESTISSAAAFSPGTPYIGFFHVAWNDSGRMLVTASIDDPAIASTVDRAMVLLDGAGGPLNEFVIAKEGDVLPGQTDPAADFGTGDHEIALNNSGAALFALDTTGATTADTALYLWNGTTLVRVLQEGAASAISGRTWGNLTGRGVDLSNSGSWVIKAPLDSSSTTDNELIVKDGVVLHREGDPAPGAAPFVFENFGLGSGPIDVDDCGRVTYIGDFNDPDTTRDVGLFRDGQLLVREGATSITTPLGTFPIRSLVTGGAGYAVSPNGWHVIFEATLEDGTPAGLNGAFMLSFCLADLNEDGEIDFSDIENFIALLNAGSLCVDFNEDGELDFSDIESFLRLYNEPCP